MTATRLCHIDDIEEGHSLGVDLSEQQSYIVVKKYGDIHVYLNRCPHLDIRLEWQENKFLDHERTFIECSTHGALFEIDTGNCIIGPCQGDQLTLVEFDIVDGAIMAHVF